MGFSIGSYILNLYADSDGFTDLERGDVQRLLEQRYHMDPSEAEKKAGVVQSVAADGTVTNEEAQKLKNEFSPVFGEKKATAEFAAITGQNKNALWKRQFQYLQGNNTIRAGVKQSTWLMEDAVIQGITLKGNTPIEFDPSGRLSKGVLNEDTLIGDFFFSKGSEVELYPDGKILSGTLAGNYGTDFGDLPHGSYVRFDGNGKLFSAVLGNGATIQGYHFPKGTRLVFREDGNLYDAVLSGNVEMQNKTYHKNQEVRFDEGSQVIARS